MFRFFSKRFGKNTQGFRKQDVDDAPKFNKHVIPCKIVLLDGSILNVEVTVSFFKQYICLQYASFCNTCC